MTIKQQGGIFGRNPTFNDVEVEGDLTVGGSAISSVGTIASQDANNVNIDGGAIDGTVIGGSSPEAITGTTGTFLGHISASGKAGGTRYIALLSETSSYTGALALQAGGGSAAFGGGVVMYGHSHAVYPGSVWIGKSSGSTGSIIFGNGGNSVGTEWARITSDGLVLPNGSGIDFSATSGTGTSELFDDYEEGNWTPVVTSSAGSLGAYSATGNYTKVGNVVSVNYNILITSNGTGSGSIVVNGLPFNQSAFRSGGVGFETDVIGFSIVSNGIGSSTLVYITKVDGTYPAGNSYRLQGSFVYQV